MLRAAIIIAALSTQCVWAIEYPMGWRAATESELAAEPLRKASATRNAKATADFNGDGKPDSAYLLKSTTFSGEGLWVWLSSPGGYMWKNLDKTEWGKEYPSVDLAMGIEIMAPGEYKTACGKGYWECESGEPEVLRLKLPGLMYFKFESAASVWHWSPKRHEFERVWLTD